MGSHAQQPDKVTHDEDDQQVSGGSAEGLWRVQGYHHPGRIDGPQKPQTLSAQLLGLPACWCVDLQQPPTLPRQFTFQLTNFV